MLFNKKLTATLLAALILTSATNAQAMGWSFTTGWRKWALFGAVATVAALVIKKMWAAPRMPAPQVVPAVQMPAPQVVPAPEEEAPIDQANELGEELIQAAFNGDLAQVQALIAAGANLEAQDIWNWTALMRAANSGYTTIVQALIDAGADLETQNRHGNTALIQASKNGLTETVRALIAAGADVNVQNHRGNTALNLAELHHRHAIVQLLRRIS